MEPRFKNKVCLVTGGGSGIGKATCMRFASEGAKVVVVDLNPEHGQSVVREIEKHSAEAASAAGAIFVKADVGNSEDVQRAVQTALDRFKKLDVLVNNAAMMTFKPILELPESDWDHVLAVNLKSVFLFCKHAIPHMPPGSAIVNTSSVHAHETEAGVAPYVASKGGMEALARCLAIECEKKKIRVNCVAPGAVNTPMLWNNPFVKSGREKVTGAVGEPDDIASAICYLASSEARFINGTTLIVDGARLDIL